MTWPAGRLAPAPARPPETKTPGARPGVGMGSGGSDQESFTF